MIILQQHIRQLEEREGGSNENRNQWFKMKEKNNKHAKQLNMVNKKSHWIQVSASKLLGD